MLSVPFKRHGLLRIGVLFSTTAAVLFAPPPSHALQSLPAELSDAAFWQMVTDFSEEGGFFRFENFVSNEEAFQAVIPALHERAASGGAYLGVGPEQNFTYVAALGPDIAFILDIRRQNMLELLMYKAIFELSPERADFLALLFSRVRPPGLDAAATARELFDGFKAAARDSDRFEENLGAITGVLVEGHGFRLSAEDLEAIRYIYGVFSIAGPFLDYSFGDAFGRFRGPRGTPTYADLMTATDAAGVHRSYLATEENFRIVREMQIKNLIVPVVGDFGGEKAIRRVGRYLEEHGARVAAFYLSNVEQYLFQQGEAWRRFYSNLEDLPLDGDSLLIRSVSTRNAFQPGAFGIRFHSVASSLEELIEAFRRGEIRTYDDLIAMPD